MKRPLIGFLLILHSSGILAKSIEQTAHQCYANNSDPYLLFASKTSYFNVDNEEAKPIEIEGCSAKSFWLLARHGSRNPGEDDISLMEIKAPEIQTAILDNYENGKGELCAADIEAISNWKLELTVEDGDLLVESGKDELRQLGQRFKVRLPDLFDEYSEEDVRFRTTNRQRTMESGKAFGEGAFPNDDVEIPPPLEDDMLLKYYDYCPKWSINVDENAETYQEREAFKETSIVLDMLSRINQRLGFYVEEEEEKPSTEDLEIEMDESEENSTEVPASLEKRDVSSQIVDRLEFDDVYIMYDLCRHEQARSPAEISVWCAAFNSDDLKVMEYYEELEYWHKDGYFYEINTQFACPLMENLVMTFDGQITTPSVSLENSTEVANNDTMEADDDVLDEYVPPKAVLYFAHSETVLPFLALLGLNKDEYALTHSNYEEAMTRKYRVSKIAPFASNIGFLMMECEEAGPKVMTFLQERPVQLPKCEDLACDWKTFKDIYASDINCLFDELCQDDGEPLKRVALENKALVQGLNLFLLLLATLFYVIIA